jgi:hypothetical protein
LSLPIAPPLWQASGPPLFVPAAQLEQSKAQLSALQSHVNEAVDEYKSTYQTQLKFDYVYRANEAPFDIQSIYHDDKFTYIKTNAPEKFSVYEMKEGSQTSSPTTCAKEHTSFRR